MMPKTDNLFILCLICPLLSLAYVPPETSYILKDDNDNAYEKCKDVPVDKMSKLVLKPWEDKNKPVRLPCGRLADQWQEWQVHLDQFELLKYSTFEPVKPLYGKMKSGYKMYSSMLDIGKKLPKQTGYYCCLTPNRVNWITEKLEVVQMYAIRVLSDEPIMSITPTPTGPVTIGSVVVLTCPKPTDEFILANAYPEVKWLKNGITQGFTTTAYGFKVKSEMNDESWQCEWSYEDLYPGEPGPGQRSIEFKSSPYIVQVK